MASILITAGRLISTSDIKLAERLNERVSIDEITGGATPQALRQFRDRIEFMFNGDLFEIAL